MIPEAATCCPNECVISVGGRCSMGMRSPVAMLVSMEVTGAATKNGMLKCFACTASAYVPG